MQASCSQAQSPIAYLSLLPTEALWAISAVASYQKVPEFTPEELGEQGPPTEVDPESPTPPRAGLLGKPPAEFSLAADPLNLPPPVIPIGVPAQLLERRPDIAAVERRMAEANEQIGIARADFDQAWDAMRL